MPKAKSAPTVIPDQPHYNHGELCHWLNLSPAALDQLTAEHHLCAVQVDYRMDEVFTRADLLFLICLKYKSGF